MFGINTNSMAAKKKVDSKVSSKFLEEMKSMLLEQKATLENELSQFASTNKNNADDYQANFPEFGDKEDENSAEVATYGDNVSLEHSLEKSLRDVRKAIARVESGSYGICKYCEESINPDRLRARPSSGSCMACKTRLKGG